MKTPSLRPGFGLMVSLVVAGAGAVACAEPPEFSSRSIVTQGAGTQTGTSLDAEGQIPPVLTAGGVPIDSSGPADTDGQGKEDTTPNPDQPVGKPRLQLALEPASAELAIGESVAFVAKQVDSVGGSVDVTAQAKWSVTGDGVAGMGASGLVRAIAAGAATVKAEFDGQLVTAALNVYAPRPGPEPRLRLTVNGADDAVVVPRRSPLTVVWESADVKSCVFAADGVTLDERTAATMTWTADAAAVLGVTCRTADDAELTASVPVTVTEPGVALTGNTAAGNLTVDAGSPVTVEWTATAAAGCQLSRDGAPIADGVRGSVEVRPTAGTTLVLVCRDTAGNVGTETLQIAVSHLNRLRPVAGGADSIPGTTVRRPLSVVFALDVTGSMHSQIEIVKNHIVRFVDELVANNFEPRLALIPFRDKVPVPGTPGDVPEGRFDLSADVAAFRTFVQTLRASAGGDANEAALGAVEEAVALLRTQDLRPDAVKTILVITDNPGHHGGSTRDCSLDQTVNLFAGMTPEEQQLYKVFYSVPAAGAACSGFATARAQMEALMTRILTGEADPARRGGLVPWPFNQPGLVNDFVGMLVRVSPPIELQCLHRDLSVTLNGAPFMTWTAPDLAAVGAAYRAGQPLSIERRLSGAERADFLAGGGRISATACCVSKAAADRGDYSVCLKEVAVAEVPFTLED